MRACKPSQFIHCFWVVAILTGGLLPLEAAKNSGKREKSLKRETSDRYLKKWIREDALYIITEEERKAFRRLTTDDERYQFIEQFWLRRDPSRDTVENESRDEHYRRITYANERFSAGIPGWLTDRGRIYITFGPPDEIESHVGGGRYARPIDEGGGITSTYPFEIWRYRHLEGPDLGNEVLIEFVDPTMTGEYRMTMDPTEKDALMYVPNAGLNIMESMGMASKADRFTDPSGMLLGPALGGRSRRYNQFERLSQFAALHRPPKVKFTDLEAVVNTKISYNLLPFNSRTDFLRITDDTVLTPITIELHHKDMTFKDQEGIQRARVNIFGRVSTITGRVVQVFEDAVVKDVPNSLLKQALGGKSLYQRVLSLSSGRYKLELVLKDLHSGNVGTEYVGIVVPKYQEGRLATSSLILADHIEKLSDRQVGKGMFVIGGNKVHPNVSEQFDRDQSLGIYFQVYNLTLDQETKLPSAAIEYRFRRDQEEIARLHENQQKLVEASHQMTLARKVSLKSLQPGRYHLEVKVTDKLSDRSVVQVGRFEVYYSPRSIMGLEE